MSEHTPTPWMLCSDKQYNNGAKLIVWTKKGPGSGAVAHVAPFCPPTSGPELEQKEADARRIVAAVNACEGISTESLEAGAVRDLVAVVEELIESASYWSEYDVPLGIVDRMREALDKAKGVTR